MRVNRITYALRAPDFFPFLSSLVVVIIVIRTLDGHGRLPTPPGGRCIVCGVPMDSTRVASRSIACSGVRLGRPNVTETRRTGAPRLNLTCRDRRASPAFFSPCTFTRYLCIMHYDLLRRQCVQVYL